MASGWSPIGNRLTYTEYLMAHSFVDDINASQREASQRVSMEISRQTRDVIASNEALAAENIRATEIAAGQISDAMQQGFGDLSGIMSDGFTKLSYDMRNISTGIEELNATFHWGFSQMLSSMGRMNDALQDLIRIAKTPAQTAAYEQYEIARDAFRQGLYQECMESLNIAINGNQASTGYKLEWRFYQMKGSVLLGFVGCDAAMIDLPQAEESFLLAARYAKTDYPEHAGKALLSAGWSSYCQGKMKEALNHTEQAIAINPNLGEALFQAAKVKMALGEVDAALPVLSKAIDQDRFYALKASGDEDFQRHDDKLRDYLNAIRQEKYRQAVPKVKEAFEKFRFWIENAPEVKDSIDIYKANEFMKNGENWPLMDILQVVQTLPELLSNIEQNAKSATFFRQTNTSAISVSYEEAYPVEETYQEEVVIKSGGLFRKAITELQTKSRTTMKIVQKSYSLQGIRLDILDGLGNSSNSFEFCQIPSGSFMMGDDKGNGPIHQVTISQDFYLGKFTVTQAQWETVMGNNPSKFKGANLPVEKVAWDDCQEFIRNLNATCKGAFRLPTEAEWEYACRAGSNGEYCFGDNETQLGDYAWYSANSGKQTQPVGKKRPNAWGLHDMHGNVFEWCQDWHNTYPSGRATDPQGASSGSFRVYRGGCWSRNANEAMSAHRISCAPNHRYDILGFRLVYVQNV